MADVTCPTCAGTGLDPKAPERHGPRHRYTTGGHDEAPPCSTCGGTGEVTWVPPGVFARQHGYDIGSPAEQEERMSLETGKRIGPE